MVLGLAFTLKLNRKQYVTLGVTSLSWPEGGVLSVFSSPANGRLKFHFLSLRRFLCWTPRTSRETKPEAVLVLPEGLQVTNVSLWPHSAVILPVCVQVSPLWPPNNRRFTQLALAARAPLAWTAAETCRVTRSETRRNRWITTWKRWVFIGRRLPKMGRVCSEPWPSR